MAASLGLAVLLAVPALPEAAEGKTTLLTNEQYAPALIDGIKEARKSVLCCYFIFKTGDGRGNLPRRVAEELVQARRRGVEVTVILETQGSRKDQLDSDNHATAALLSKGGVKVFFDSPGVTTHAKVTVIDDRYVYLGSHNLTQSALRHNNELSLLLDSPQLAAEIRSYLGRL